jgi:hypothetical protein
MPTLQPTQVESPLLNTSGLLVLHAAIFLYWVAAVLVDVVVGGFVGGQGCNTFQVPFYTRARRQP